LAIAFECSLLDSGQVEPAPTLLAKPI